MLILARIDIPWYFFKQMKVEEIGVLLVKIEQIALVESVD
jgi:hypothetical protein